jgi:hypothetical protein
MQKWVLEHGVNIFLTQKRFAVVAHIDECFFVAEIVVVQPEEFNQKAAHTLVLLRLHLKVIYVEIVVKNLVKVRFELHLCITIIPFYVRAILSSFLDFYLHKFRNQVWHLLQIGEILFMDHERQNKHVDAKGIES